MTQAEERADGRTGPRFDKPVISRVLLRSELIYGRNYREGLRFNEMEEIKCILRLIMINMPYAR